MPNGAKPLAARVSGWLSVHALPLWAGKGFDAQGGGFVDCLSADGEPMLGSPRRCMLQARQLYVFSHAAMLGLVPDTSVARKGFEFLMRHGAPDGAEQGFVHVMDRNGRVLDARRDLYDHAFLLLAFSWYYRASGDARARQAMDDVVTAIQALRHPSGIGYLENNEGALPRRQNSHMQLLEGFLAAFAATGQFEMLSLASDMVQLLVEHFLYDGVLLEYFEDNWRPAPQAIMEPGHHQEWVWLLRQFNNGGELVMRQLYDSVLRHGMPAQSRLLYNEVWSDGLQPKDAAKRLWPQTEHLKAELALGLPGEETVERIFKHFLDPASVKGAWIDRLDASNAPIQGTIPASSLYHVFLAFSEFLAEA